jgi:hypothetical protein
MVEDDFEEPRVDRTAVSLVIGFDDMERARYWQSRTPAERMEHLELLRRINYGDAATGRVQRVIEFARCPWG